MKKILYCLIVSLFACLQVQAQVEPPIPPPPPPLEEQPKNEAPNQIYTVVQQIATFPGGQESLAKFLRQNFQYPKNAQRMGITGKVYTRFVVTKTGAITDVATIKGIQNCPECNEEAIRLVKMMPNWNPAVHNEKPVSMYYALPIVFELIDNKKGKK